MHPIIQFIKNWSLPISMLAGACGYFIYDAIPFLAPTKHFALEAIGWIQPVLIFSMLYITFCKIDPRSLRFKRWHVWLLLFQAALFTLLTLVLRFTPHSHAHLLIEASMLCLICPTATAAAVVTGKLNGDAASLTTYTIAINLTTALLVPLCLPLIHPDADTTFGHSFALILAKVFPMLFCPFILAMVTRYYMHALHRRITSLKNLAFELWIVALALAIAVTTRSIVHSEVSVIYQVGIAGVSLVCCILQFGVGKMVGRHYGCPITAGQSLGQKNTVFAIWMGYTFLTPVTAIAGGFYSVWHNVYNAYQLNRMRKKEVE